MHRKQSKLFVEATSLIFILLLVACTPVTPPPTPTITPIPTSTPTPVARVQVEPSNDLLEKDHLNEERKRINNCEGDAMLEEIGAPNVSQVLEIKDAVVVIDSTGWIDIPYIGKVDIGPRIAEEYGMEYGLALPTPIPITINSAPGTHIEYVFDLSVQKATGYILIHSLNSDREVRYRYVLPTSLVFELVGENFLDCPPTPTPIPTATSISFIPLELPWHDNFETRLGEEWSQVEGIWSVENGYLTAGSSRGMIVVGDPNWTDYIFEVDISSMTKGFGSVTIGVMLRMQDLNNYIRFVMDCENGTRWELVENGQTQILSNWIRVSCDGYHLKLRAINDLYESYIDENLISSFRNDVFTSGFIGLSSSGSAFEGGNTSFDNVFVSYPE